ncbi:MAG: cysteine desulfurase family protein [Saprospiraceae bacterium]
MLNIAEKIYLDHAASTPLDPEVILAMTNTMKGDFGNPSSIHSQGRKTRILIENARKIIAQSIHSSIGEIYFTSSATESNNAVIKAAVKDLKIKRIISAKSEHHCVLNSILSLDKDVDVKFLQLDKRGNISPVELESLVSVMPNETLVSLMHVNNEIGTMLDLQKVSDICVKHGALLHTDAVQSLAKYEMDVQKIQITFLSGTAHKINGPKGCGFLYINSNTSIKTLMYGGSQERNMRAGTENLYGIVGLGRTVELWNEQREERMAHILKVRAIFKNSLLNSGKDFKFMGNQDQFFAPHILSVSIPRDDRSDMIMMNLDIAGICASSGSACSSGSEHESHVLEAIRANKKRKVVRFSFSYMTNIEEARIAASRFINILK